MYADSLQILWLDVVLLFLWLHVSTTLDKTVFHLLAEDRYSNLDCLSLGVRLMAGWCPHLSERLGNVGELIQKSGRKSHQWEKLFITSFVLDNVDCYGLLYLIVYLAFVYQVSVHNFISYELALMLYAWCKNMSRAVASLTAAEGHQLFGLGTVSVIHVCEF